MTDRIALWLFCLIALAVTGDAVLNDWQASTFMAGKFLQLVDWVKFWR